MSTVAGGIRDPSSFFPQERRKAMMRKKAEVWLGDVQWSHWSQLVPCFSASLECPSQLQILGPKSMLTCCYQLHQNGAKATGWCAIWRTSADFPQMPSWGISGSHVLAGHSEQQPFHLAQSIGCSFIDTHAVFHHSTDLAPESQFPACRDHLFMMIMMTVAENWNFCQDSKLLP